MSNDLLAHWPLRGDCRDRSANGNDGVNHGVYFTETDPANKSGGAARFDGVASHIVVPSSKSLELDDRDFTLSLHVHTEEDAGSPAGDLLQKYDPGNRKGLNLGLLDFAGVTSSQPNWRNLFLGLDDGAHDDGWRDCGRPGNAVLVWALAVYRGDLYAGTFESGASERGHVYRYAGGDAWEDCGSPHPCNAVTALAVFEDSLYAGVGHYRSSGSALAESENVERGGHVYRYEGGTSWSSRGDIDNLEAIFGLVRFQGRLHASSMYAPGVYRYEGGHSWKPCGHPGGRVGSMAPYRGRLYCGGYDAATGGAHAYDGASWTDLGGPPETTQTYSFMLHEGALYAGTWPQGKVFRYGADGSWFDTGRLGQEREVMAMAIYNGKLYAGTLPLAEVYRYDEDGHWRSTGQLDRTPDVKYRRAWSMAVFQGRLFCGTLPSGKVFALRTGACASHDTALAPGWRHVAAVRHGSDLKLFVDGAPVATAAVPRGLDISNGMPLRIGFGAHDYFEGLIRNVRIYGRALNESEINNLGNSTEL